MIKLQRGPEPPFLISPKVMAAKEKLIKRFNDSARQDRFQFNISLLGDIKSDLMAISYGKCSYCESSLGVASHGDVENFRPKAGASGLNRGDYAPSHYWWLAYEWDNLLMSCQICNQKYKRDYFPLADESQRAQIGAKGQELINENALLIDPTAENPSEHLLFHDNGLVSDLSMKGRVSIEILGLNRAELVEKRRQAALDLSERLELLQLHATSENAIIKSVLASIADLYQHPTREYVAVQRAVFEAWQVNHSQLWESLLEVDHKNIPIDPLADRHFHTSPPIQHPVEKDVDSLNLKRFSIKSIFIENFKSIEQLSLSIPPIDEVNQRESWLLLLGDNGIGKSSILQAVALALAGERQLDKLELDVMDFLRKGSSEGRIVVESHEHDASVELAFDKNGFRTTLREAPTFILAYGSTRLLPKGVIKPDPEKEPYVNIRNLFDYTVSLESPSKWLSSIDQNEFNERVAPVFFDILSLRTNDKVSLINGSIHITQHGDQHELEDNSDGYKTIVAMTADIMQTISLDKANYHNSQGIVFIDEIGNHLHPRWRMKIVSAIRRAFPKLQFIVSTHEPLCLRGLSYGEVVVLVRDENNAVRALDKQILPDHSLMRIEQLLTSDLFGLISVMDEETEKTYEEYYYLLSKREEQKSPEDKEKILTLSAKLNTQELLGNTPQEQLFYQLIGETYTDKLMQSGFKTIHELKEETIATVKDMIKNNKPSWL